MSHTGISRPWPSPGTDGGLCWGYNWYMDPGLYPSDRSFPYLPLRWDRNRARPIGAILVLDSHPPLPGRAEPA